MGTTQYKVTWECMPTAPYLSRSNTLPIGEYMSNIVIPSPHQTIETSNVDFYESVMKVLPTTKVMLTLVLYFITNISYFMLATKRLE